MYYSLKEITKIANNLLKKLNINEPSINPRKIAKLLNVKFSEENFSDEVSGALTFKEDTPFILCNINHSPNRQRFTIAHELGHYILKHGRDGLFVDKANNFIFRNEESSTGEKRQEREANAFAAALLMPEDMVASEMYKLIGPNGIDLNDDSEDLPFIKDLANIFEVSPKAMTYRIANLRLLDNF